MNNKIIEALLFIQGSEGLSSEQLKDVLKLNTTNEARLLLRKFKEEFNKQEHGIMVAEFNDVFKFLTTPAVKWAIEELVTIVRKQHLSTAGIEVAGIIAYKQPITRLEVESIRGVQCSGAIQKLLLRDLIEEAGRMDSPGRPKLYRTTTYFMDYFGLETLDQLPDVESLLELNQEESKQLFKNNEDLFAELEQMHQEEETIS